MTTGLSLENLAQVIHAEKQRTFPANALSDKSRGRKAKPTKPTVAWLGGRKLAA